MSAHSRTKGIRYEREICEEIFRSLSFRVTRNLGQERDGGSDIRLKRSGGGAFILECKRRKKIAGLRQWLAQVEANRKFLDVPVVVLRADGWDVNMVALDLRDFLSLISEQMEI